MVFDRYVKPPRKTKSKKAPPKTKTVTPKDPVLHPYALGKAAAVNGGTNPFDTNSSAGEVWQAGYDGD